LANSLIFEIDDSIRDLPGATSARKLLVSRALQYLDRLSGEASGDPSLQRELATAYERVGDVLGHPYAANLGDTPGALTSYRKALAIRESLAAASMRADSKLQNEIVGNYFRIANVLEVPSDRTGALNAFQRALPIAQQLKQNSPSPVFADQLAGIHYYIAQLLARGGDLDHALANYEQARSIRSEALEQDPQNISLRSHLAADYIGIAKLVELNGRHDEAIAMETKAVDILQQLARDNQNSASLREYYAESLSQIGGLYEAKGDHESAVTSARQSHEIFRNLLAADQRIIWRELTLPSLT
jgi:non-specific serine/threonine protein kinase/serine/threonine-protein kinase